MTDVKLPHNSMYTEDVKDAFVLEYYKRGSLKSAATELSIPYETVKSWNRAEWFIEKLTRVKNEADKQMDRKITTIVDLAFEQVEDRVRNGEERMDKNGKVVIVKANMTSLATTIGILFDKRQLIRKAPTNTDTNEDVLTKLAEKLVQFAKPKNKEVIDVEFREQPEKDKEEGQADPGTDRGVPESLLKEAV